MQCVHRKPRDIAVFIEPPCGRWRVDRHGDERAAGVEIVTPAKVTVLSDLNDETAVTLAFDGRGLAA